MSNKISIFFPVFADIDNYNAQSLNEREIARRLDPKRFECTLFYAKEPDPSVMGLSNIRLVKIPSRLGTFIMLSESIKRCDIIFSPSINRFSNIYFRIPRVVRGRTKVIYWIESHIKDHIDSDHKISAADFIEFISRMDKILAITDHVSETSFRDFGIRAEKVIQIGVDTKLFSPLEKRTNKKLRVLFVGHLIERKGPQFVLQAAARFRNTEFVLVGEKRGDFYKDLFETVREKGIENVTFLDPIPHSQLSELMMKSDIILHPSLTESVGKVVLEGAATGLPGILFSDYRSPAVVDGVSGFQVNTFNEMLERLELLINDEELRKRMGENAIIHARKFDWDLIVPQWEKVFAEVVQQK